MEILFLLIPLSVVLAFAIGVTFWWSVASGQFDDLEGPAHRIVVDDDSIESPQPREPLTSIKSNPRTSP